MMDNLAAGLSRIGELTAVCEVTGSELPPYVPLALAAWRGRETEVSDLSGATIRGAQAQGESLVPSAGEWALTVLYNGAGRYQKRR
jgi:hypothetical protein